jgi:hypothetical protein
MKHKIVKMFLALSPNRREIAMVDIALKFKRRTISVHKHWLTNPTTPLEYQDEVLQILEKELEDQIIEHQELIKRQISE